MNSLISRIMHHVIRFCYPFLQDIEREKRTESDHLLKSRFMRIGDCCFLGENPCIYNPEYISIGNKFNARKFLRLEALTEYGGCHYSPRMVIGENVSIEDFVHIGCASSVTIGDGCLFASKVFITDHFHGSISAKDISLKPNDRELSCKPVNIGSNVWLGDNVCIMPGVTLGDNVIVGANAVVTHSFPDNVVIAGCPARILKHLVTK